MADLPAPARRLLLATAIAAALLALAALLVDSIAIAPLHVVSLGAGIALGELLRIDLPHRSGGTASFGLGDAALTAGLLLFGPAEVVIGALIGVAALQAVERVSPIKFAMNVAQYTAGTAAAALAVQALAPRPGDIGPQAVAAVVVGVALFLGVNAVTVGGMIALTSGRSLRTTVQQLLPTGGLLALGDLALGVIAVLLLQEDLWALPALAVPVALLWLASRQGVRARVDRERGAAFVEVEHALGAARTPTEVVGVIAAAPQLVLGCQGAVWRNGAWQTPVPDGSTACPVDASLAVSLTAPGSTLGLAVTDQSVAIGLGGGVLVAWPGQLGLDADAGGWMERLGRSARVHFTRAAGAVALEAERATLGAVVDGTGDGVLLLDHDGTVAVWNPAMARLSGIPTDDAVGQTVVTLLGDGPWLEDGVHDVAPPGTDSVWRIAVAGVEGAALAGVAVPGPGHASTPATGRLSVVAVHDVTAERRASRARDDMLSVVSHELRTPLTPIIASAQMLRRRADRLDPAQRDTLVAQIEDRAAHLARLIDDLLLVGQMSTAVAPAPRLSAEPIEVGDLVADAVAAMRLARPQHQLSVQVRPGCAARTDPMRLRQIVDNLLDNACKFSEPGAPVEALVAPHPEDEDRVVITVADRGRGIPPADLDRVFEQFARVEDPLTMTTSGAGLGLYIVRELTEALGGTLSLQSQVGVGTQITVRLPRSLLREDPAGVSGQWDERAPAVPRQA